MLTRLADPESYRPQWAATDREMWDRVPEATRDFWIARAERYREFSWPPLAPLYADFQTTGNRQRFEAVYHRRRQVATTLCAGGGARASAGASSEPLADAIARISDEPSWVLPAHEQHTIDLFSAETANLFAWVLYLFRADASFARSAVAMRAAEELRRRVLEPYLGRDDFWWMALEGQKPNNWTTWCTSNCLGIRAARRDRRAAARAGGDQGVPVARSLRRGLRRRRRLRRGTDVLELRGRLPVRFARNAAPGQRRRLRPVRAIRRFTTSAPTSPRSTSTIFAS
jgi:hypothetical protein